MARFAAVDPTTTTGKARTMLRAVEGAMGRAPNLTRTLANAPAALDGYLSLDHALAGGVLGARLRVRIAVLVAQANGCAYGVAMHSTFGKLAGLGEDELLAARRATAPDARVGAALAFAHAVVARRGAVTEQDIDAVLQAGYSDEAVLEMVGVVGLNTLANYVTLVAETDVDFPPVGPSLFP